MEVTAPAVGGSSPRGADGGVLAVVLTYNSPAALARSSGVDHAPDDRAGRDPGRRQRERCRTRRHRGGSTDGPVAATRRELGARGWVRHRSAGVPGRALELGVGDGRRLHGRAGRARRAVDRRGGSNPDRDGDDGRSRDRSQHRHARLVWSVDSPSRSGTRGSTERRVVLVERGHRVPAVANAGCGVRALPIHRGAGGGEPGARRHREAGVEVLLRSAQPGVLPPLHPTAGRNTRPWISDAPGPPRASRPLGGQARGSGRHPRVRAAVS